MDIKSLPEIIADFRRLGWTQARLAAAVGTSQPTIHRISEGIDPAYSTGIALVLLHAREIGGASRSAA